MASMPTHPAQPGQHPDPWPEARSLPDLCPTPKNHPEHHLPPGQPPRGLAPPPTPLCAPVPGRQKGLFTHLCGLCQLPPIAQRSRCLWPPVLGAKTPWGGGPGHAGASTSSTTITGLVDHAVSSSACSGLGLRPRGLWRRQCPACAAWAPSPGQPKPQHRHFSRPRRDCGEDWEAGPPAPESGRELPRSGAQGDSHRQEASPASMSPRPEQTAEGAAHNGRRTPARARVRALSACVTCACQGVRPTARGPAGGRQCDSCVSTANTVRRGAPERARGSREGRAAAPAHSAQPPLQRREGGPPLGAAAPALQHERVDLGRAGGGARQAVPSRDLLQSLVVAHSWGGAGEGRGQ